MVQEQFKPSKDSSSAPKKGHFLLSCGIFLGLAGLWSFSPLINLLGRQRLRSRLFPERSPGRDPKPQDPGER